MEKTEGAGFSVNRVNAVVRALSGRTKSEARENWLASVAAHTVSSRPDIATELLDVLGVSAGSSDFLSGLSIGEIGVCYEALLARLDTDSRKKSGQYFTPDDAASFMARQSGLFPPGTWMDPCCGVGNLAWHLVANQDDPGVFIRESLILVDQDATALKTAIALIAAKYANQGDGTAVKCLAQRSRRRNFLSRQPLPNYDFAILNPPYARAPQRPGFETASTRDLFAYFVERIVKTSRGFIAVTPASYLSASRYAPLRTVLERESAGGRVFVFDNVPDTLFRGFKFGSTNTSRTNFVRAAVTVSAPGSRGWEITPILRWQTSDRSAMFAKAATFLGPLGTGPDGEWVKLVPGMGDTWAHLSGWSRTLADLAVTEETDYFLDVATTPRYYISAAFRGLERGSKVRLHFRTVEDRDLAAVVLNSSVPYLWWRGLDGGVTLPRRLLMSVPIPNEDDVDLSDQQIRDLARLIRESEASSVVTKLNAGRTNENIKHDPRVVDRLNQVLLPVDIAPLLELVYASSMFSNDRRE